MDNQENSVTFSTGTFGFSGTNINDIEVGDAVTLVGIAVDTSYSIGNFTKELTNALKDVVRSCQSSPRSDNLMIRVVNFDVKSNEYHGFKELNKCDVNVYNNTFSKLGNSTALYDACVDTIESINKYGGELTSSDYTVNGIVVVLTDGDDNNSSQTKASVKKALQTATGEKKLESLVSILVGVNTDDAGVSILLKDFAREAGFTKYIDIKEASPKEIAKLAQFISKSISSQSQTLAGGSTVTSQSLSF